MPWAKELVDVRYLNLLNLASQLKAGKGLTVVTSFLRGSLTSPDDRKRAEQASFETPSTTRVKPVARCLTLNL